MKIIIIEDDYTTGQTLKALLKSDYTVEVALSAREAENLLLSTEFQLIICDIILSDKNGIQLCRELRKRGVQTPILMLTGRFETEQKIEALDAGADDYLVKPFVPEELQARIRALLRRSPQSFTSNILEAGDISIDMQARMVKRGEKTISLRRKELDLLEYLVRNSGRVLSKDKIIDHLWKSSAELRPNTIEVHIKYLRDQIDRPFPKKVIKTIYGVGYKLDA